MSGGSKGYVYGMIEEYLCGQMYDDEINDLMKDVAKLAHDVEWYTSCDYGEDTYRESVLSFKEKWFKAPREERLKGYIDNAINKLKKELYMLIGEKMD